MESGKRRRVGRTAIEVTEMGLGGGPLGNLMGALGDDEATAALQPILMRLCATYLLEARQGERALDRVAHFHLSNGARLERINWLADTSANGLEQAAGTMVNYLYRLADIEKNHESYRGAGKIAAAPAVKRLV